MPIDTIHKVIDKCRDCPCFTEEFETAMYEGDYHCNLYDATNETNPQMVHDVDKGIDPNCPMKKNNYYLSVMTDED